LQLLVPIHGDPRGFVGIALPLIPAVPAEVDDVRRSTRSTRGSQASGVF